MVCPLGHHYFYICPIEEIDILHSHASRQVGFHSGGSICIVTQSLLEIHMPPMISFRILLKTCLFTLVFRIWRIIEWFLICLFSFFLPYSFLLSRMGIAFKRAISPSTSVENMKATMSLTKLAWLFWNLSLVLSVYICVSSYFVSLTVLMLQREMLLLH